MDYDMIVAWRRLVKKAESAKHSAGLQLALRFALADACLEVIALRIRLSLLENYAGHFDNCTSRAKDGGECDCGFDTIEVPS